MGKCFFSLVVPGTILFTREMNLAISRGIRTHHLVKIDNNLPEEITHWPFLETWDDPLPRRDERHIQISLATVTSGTCWGASLMSQETLTVSDLWSVEERTLDINTREALAFDKALASFPDLQSWSKVLGQITTDDFTGSFS